jgi:glutamine amidotransferase/cyclase
MSKGKLYLLDYGAGNVRSLSNSLTRLGYTFEWISDASDFEKADVRLIFSFLHADEGLTPTLESRN